MQQQGDSMRAIRGFSLMELLIGMLISSFVIAAVMQQYSLGVTQSINHKIRTSAVLQAQAALQTIGSEIRMLGNGVPFDQSNFQIGEDTLLDPSVTEPLLVANATANSISFRLNETGDVFLLTQEFDPATSSTMFLTDTSSLQENDPIYLSNATVSRDDGL